MKKGFITTATIITFALIGLSALGISIYKDGHKEVEQYPIVVETSGVELNLGGPQSQSTRDVVPFTTQKYYIGSSSPASLEYKGIFTQNLTVSGTCTGCGAGSGEANTASNLDVTNFGVFDGKVGVDLQFNTLKAGSNVTISTTTNDNIIEISSTGGGGASFGQAWEINPSGNLTPTTTPLTIEVSNVTATSTTAESTFTDVTISGTATTTGALIADGEFRYQSVTKTQTLTAGSQILATTTVLNISSASDIVMAGSPIIATSTNGAILILRNVGDFVIDLEDNSVGGSGVFHGGTTCNVNPRDEVTMMFQSDADGSGNEGWVILSHPNLVSGGDATLLDVRNTSGSTITAGSPVYATGWNNGQSRATIALADADGSNTTPAIGVTLGSIANNANGQIITSGELEGIDTSSFSVGDNLYLSTTAGEFVVGKPATDQVQKIAEVLRSHASQGVILIQGAGRTNDVPNHATTTTSFSTTASSTNLFTSNFSIASLTGFLKATAGAVATALIDLANDVTGILPDANVADDITIDSSIVVTAPNFVADSASATSTFAGGLTIDTNWSYDPDGKIQRFGITPAVEVFSSARVRFADEDGTHSDWSFNVAGGGWGSVAFGASNGTLASPTISLDEDLVGVVNFLGYDGAVFRKTAQIVSKVNGTPGSGDMPGLLGFDVTPDGSTNPVRAMTIVENGNVGIGTTSPGSLLSLGDTGNNTINISATATSTFGSGMDIRSGCFSINGTCVSGGGGGSSKWTDNGSYLTTIGGEFIDVSHFVATSTTATSSIENALVVGGGDAGVDNLVRIIADRTYSSSLSQGGAVNITNTGNQRPALKIYTNEGAASNNEGVLTIQIDNTAHTQGGLLIDSDGTNGSDYAIKLNGVTPDIEFDDESYASESLGAFEIDVGDAFGSSTVGRLTMNFRNNADNSFVRGIGLAKSPIFDMGIWGMDHDVVTVAYGTPDPDLVSPRMGQLQLGTDNSSAQSSLNEAIIDASLMFTSQTGGCNASSRYHPGTLWGTYDSSLTNPKWFSGIFGTCEETFGADSDSGSGLEFWVGALNDTSPHQAAFLNGTDSTFKVFDVTNSGTTTINALATATSTFSGGIDVTGGCLAIDGTCVSGGAAGAAGATASTTGHTILVAANDATTAEKARADYIADGTADEVQINLALVDVKTSGGKVQLSSGNFTLAAAIALVGKTANNIDNPETVLHGSGIDSTIITAASGINAIELTDEPKYDIGFMTLAISGAADGLNQVAGTERGNWQSHVHDLFIKTDFSTHGTDSWGIKMESPFRMRFTNIEMNGVANGMWLTSHVESFNPGNLSVDRLFVDLWNDASVSDAIGVKLSTTATTSTGHFNLASFDRVDIAGGSALTGSIGIHLIGATQDPGGTHFGEVRQNDFNSMNIEDVQTAFKLEAASDNSFTNINYTRVLDNGTVFDLDDESLNNEFDNMFLDSNTASLTVNVINDLGNDTGQPNVFSRLVGFSAGTATLNATLSASSILRHVKLTEGDPTLDADLTEQDFKLGDFDLSSATVKQHMYPSFTWPSSATTTTATTTQPLASAFTAEQWETSVCRVTSGASGYRYGDGSNFMEYIVASTTVGRFSLSTNNTFIVDENRVVEIGPLTNAQITCTVDKIVNN